MKLPTWSIYCTEKLCTGCEGIIIIIIIIIKNIPSHLFHNNSQLYLTRVTLDSISTEELHVVALNPETITTRMKHISTNSIIVRI